MTTAKETYEAAELRTNEMVAAAMFGLRAYLGSTRGARHRATVEQLDPREFRVHCADGTDVYFKVMEV